MARRLGAYFDFDAIELRSLMSEGQRKQARQFALDVLGKGKASPEFQKLAADVHRLSSKQLKAIYPQCPRHWYQIGQVFEELCEQRKGKPKVGYNAAVEQLMARWDRYREGIVKALQVYREAWRAYDEARR